MAKIITVATQKGGVGKTSTSHLIALGFKEKGLRVLLIDLDPQTNLTYIGGAFEQIPTIYDVLTGKTDIREAIFHGGEVDIVPGSTELVGSDLEFNKNGREYILQEALDPIRNDYDLIVIDCPPALGTLTVNALTASNSVIIPCGADILSIQGFSQFYDLIESVRKYSNKGLTISGLVVTRYDTRANLSADFTAELKRISGKLHVNLYSTRIREGVAVKRYQANMANPYKTEARSGPIQDYTQLIEEIAKHEKIKEER